MNDQENRISLGHGLWFVRGAHRGHFPFCNSLLIAGEGRAFLLDASLGPETTAALEAEFSHITLILTHGHPDHLLDAELLTPDEVWASAADLPGLRSMADLWPWSGLAGYGHQELTSLFHDRDLRVAIPPVSRALQGGELLTLGEHGFRVLALPGHTPGHLGFYEPTQKLLFAADLGLPPQTPWYATSVSDLDDYIASLQSLRGLDVDWLLSSHEEPQRVELEPLLDQTLAELEQREQRIYDALQQPRTVDELANRGLIYPGVTSLRGIMLHFDKQMIRHHLARLQRRRLITSDQNHYVQCLSRDK